MILQEAYDGGGREDVLTGRSIGGQQDGRGDVSSVPKVG